MHDFSVGSFHALVKASPKTDMNTTKLFATGKFEGIREIEEIQKGVFYLNDFDNVQNTWMICGKGASLMGFTPQEDSKCTK